MRIAGRDYVFKLMSPEFLDSLFNVRKQYFLRGEPSEIGRNKTAFFVAKFKKDPSYKRYMLVGQARVKDVSRIRPTDNNHAFAAENGWNFVIDLEDLKKFPTSIPSEEIFPESTLKKFNGQRPFGVELSPEESRTVKEKISNVGY